MLKGSRIRAGIAVWVGLIAGLSWLDFSSQPPRTEQSQADQKPGEQSQSNLSSPFDPIFCWLGSLTAEQVIAFFTIILAGGTVSLVFDSRRHSERQLRAYVNCRVGRIFNFDKTPIAKIIFRNNGTTPAYDVKISSIGAFAAVPLVGELPSGTGPPESAGVLGPHSDFHIQQSFEGSPGSALTEEHKLAITAGTNGIYVYGTVTYRDAFGRNQWTTFRLLYSGNEWIMPIGSMTVCGEGNDAS